MEILVRSNGVMNYCSFLKDFGTIYQNFKPFDSMLLFRNLS